MHCRCVTRTKTAFPGAQELGEFVQERLDRAAAKPAAERSYDEAALLRAYALLDAARLHTEAAAQQPRGTASSTPHQLLAALCSLGAVQAITSILGPQLPVAMHFAEPVLAILVTQLGNRLVGGVCRLRLVGPPAVTVATSALLTVALCDCTAGFGQCAEDAPWWNGLDALRAAQDRLFRANAEADLGAELAGLQQASAG